MAKIEVLITCVDYCDFLSITLPETRRFFESITVATSRNDPGTLEVARRYGVKVHETDIWYKNGASFDKSAALNECLAVFENREDDLWILLLDADILFVRGIEDELATLDKRGLYSIRRRVCERQEEWQAYQEGRVKWHEFPCCEDPPIIDNKIWEQPTTNAAGLFGYVQLWNLKFRAGARQLPASFNAANYDVLFAMSFPDHLRSYLKDHEVLHLGPPNTNWDGRVSLPWTF